MEHVIPHSKPTVDHREIEAVSQVIRSGYMACGPATAELEDLLSKKTGRPVACVSSGTAALHLALIALGVKTGDVIAIPTHCCPSVLYAVQYTGAIAKPYDCGKLGLGSPDNLIDRLTGLEKAILLVHHFGIPDPAVEKNFNMLKIEDCAASLGASINGRSVGSFSDAAIYSFYPTKMIAGGESGALASSAKTIELIRDIRSPRGADSVQTHYPYSPSDLSSSIAAVQMEKLDWFIQQRTEIATRYTEELSAFMQVPEIVEGVVPAWHRYIVASSKSRDDVIKKARESGICFGYGVKTPIHRLMQLEPKNYPTSEHAFSYAVSLPIYPGLSERDQERVIHFLKKHINS